MARLLDLFTQRQLAEASGRSEAMIYQMSKAVGTKARPVIEEAGERIEAALGLTPGWFNIPDAPLPGVQALSSGADRAASPQQVIARLQGDVDQLRLALGAVVGWATGSIPGAGDDLEQLLKRDVDRYYADHGFHGLLLELIGRIRATQAAEIADSAPAEVPAKRRQSR